MHILGVYIRDNKCVKERSWCPRELLYFHASTCTASNYSNVSNKIHTRVVYAHIRVCTQVYL